MQIHLVGAGLFRAVGQTDTQTARQTQTDRLIAAFCTFESALRKWTLAQTLHCDLNSS